MVYSLAFSLPGTPVLFYGEEIGMGENLEIEGRLAVRSPMQWSPRSNAGFSSVREPSRLCRPINSAKGFDCDAVNVADQYRDPGSLLNWFERLIRRRRECPELGWGEWKLLDAGDAAVFAHLAEWEEATVVAVHNLADREAEARLEPGGSGELVDLFRDEDHKLSKGAATLELGPYDARWFRVRRPGRRLPP